MSDTAFRLWLLLRLLAFMAVIYLSLAVMVDRFSKKPGSKLRWFFEVVSGPLTLPVRALMPAGTPERRLRWLALALALVVWLIAGAVTERPLS